MSVKHTKRLLDHGNTYVSTLKVVSFFFQCRKSGYFQSSQGIKAQGCIF